MIPSGDSKQAEHCITELCVCVCCLFLSLTFIGKCLFELFKCLLFLSVEDKIKPTFIGLFLLKGPITGLQ